MRFLINLLDFFYFIKNILIAKVTYKKRFLEDKKILDNINNTKFRKNYFLDYLDKANFNKTILLCEVNNFHFELLDSIIFYFSKIGFNVDVLVCTNTDYKSHKNTFKLDLENIIYSLNDEKIKKYDFVFFNTMVLSLNTLINILEIIKPKAKFGLLGIYHTLSDIKRFKDYKNYTEGRYFALRHLDFKDIKLDALSCSVESNILKTNNTNKITTFISIGFPVYHLNFRLNLYLIIKTMLKQNITNFRFILIGRNEFKIKDEFREFISCFINSSKEELNEIIKLNKPHYVFGFFDRFAHRHYLKDSTSGLVQFSLMHNLPFVINEPFGSSFGFTNKNAIIYNNPSLGIYNAIKQLNTPRYQEIKENLMILNEKLLQDSINNLSKTINFLVKPKNLQED